jgi:hypothetical protein
MKKLIYAGIFFVAIGMFSCDAGDEPGIDGTATQKLAGEWFLQLRDESGKLVIPYSLVTTSNTAANVATELWFVDHSFFGTQSKLAVDPNALTFTTTDGQNIDFAPAGAPDDYPLVALGKIEKVISASAQTVTITNGKVLKDSFIAPSKAKTDSMYMQITGKYVEDTYQASEYKITTVGGVPDTTVVWKLTGSAIQIDGPYTLSGYRRTGFREDEH